MSSGLVRCGFDGVLPAVVLAPEAGGLVESRAPCMGMSKTHEHGGVVVFRTRGVREQFEVQHHFCWLGHMKGSGPEISIWTRSMSRRCHLSVLKWWFRKPEEVGGSVFLPPGRDDIYDIWILALSPDALDTGI